jgi:hypothetical protein
MSLMRSYRDSYYWWLAHINCVFAYSCCYRWKGGRGRGSRTDPEALTNSTSSSSSVWLRHSLWPAIFFQMSKWLVATEWMRLTYVMVMSISLASDLVAIIVLRYYVGTHSYVRLCAMAAILISVFAIVSLCLCQIVSIFCVRGGDDFVCFSKWRGLVNLRFQLRQECYTRRDLYGTSSVGMLQPVSHIVLSVYWNLLAAPSTFLCVSAERVTGVLLLLLPSSVSAIIVYAYAIFTL